MFDRNPINVRQDGVVEMTLRDRYGRPRATVLFDSKHLPAVSGRVWGLRGRYAATASRDFTMLHRLVTGAADGVEVDHISGDTLDCRDANLRVLTHAQNMQNRKSKAATGHRNVYFTRDGRYSVQITAGGRRFYAGTFDDLADAVAAAKALRTKHYTHAVESRH